MASDIPSGPTTPEDRRHRGKPEDSPAPKLLVVLLDISESMGNSSGGGRTAIAELNEKLGSYINEVGESSFGRDGQLAVCAFFESQEDEPTFFWIPLGRPVRDGSVFHWARDAVVVDRNGTRLQKLDLVARGRTPLGAAVVEALDCIEERVEELADSGRQPNPRPVLLVLTDGMPTDPRVVAEVTPRVHAMEDELRLAFWIGGMEGASREYLLEIADKGNFVDLGDRGIDSFIRLMSASIDAAKGARRTAREVYDELNRKWARAAVSSSDA